MTRPSVEFTSREGAGRGARGEPASRSPRSVVALGVFDGVHRGHQEIFRQVVARAKAVRGTSVVYTFDPHPVTVVAPSAAPKMINTIRQRVALIEDCGIDRVVVQNFTKEFSQQTPEQFFERVIVERLKARELFAGYNFTFGVRRSGTAETLEALARRVGIDVHVVSPFLVGETLVSSTQVRQFLAAGDLPRAEELLARSYFIEGKVVKGRGIGGKELGLHTANLDSENDAILPTGVYVSFATAGGRRFRSVTNIGPNPTFGSGPVTIETHILEGFRRNIVGRRIRVEFLQKIREEIRFATPSDLANQIRSDIQMAARVFAERK
ncbi:MAG TPA: bifunctional riboflavin kinase/FAD synthetase [bacterium]|nr:bifunctional riboflavin kinase/FAD synthetase [bacterium]